MRTLFSLLLLLQTTLLAMSDADAQATSDMLEAQERESLQTIRQQRATTTSAPLPNAPAPIVREVPSWYFHFGLGATQLALDSATQSSLDALYTSDTRSYGIALDFGVYMTIECFLFGYAIMGNVQMYDTPRQSYSLATGGFSTLFFPFSDEHQGVYLRADLSAGTYSPINDTQEHNQTGLGLVGGVGYRMGIWNFALNAMAVDSPSMPRHLAYNAIVSVMW
ncbi:MAG: hypothetical protein KU37_08720 [Sulfuricurvum sp. PC08-66]|nr:MAG: hypothetical protein KU37_08720 [Sulfuricurvum sp. PC08-66]